MIQWFKKQFKNTPFFFKGIFFLYLILFLIGIYSFIEARIIQTEEVTIPLGIQKKIILISDLHLGQWFWKWEDFLTRIVEKTNIIKADYILIAGDFTYYPDEKNLKNLFSSFTKSNKPIYAVLGNHDVGFPGPLYKKELTEALTSDNVHILENKIIPLDGFTLIWLWELWEWNMDISILNKIISPEKTIVLLHNPDIIPYYAGKKIPALTLAGHTHGWQMRIPWLYKYVIPTIGDFDRGYGEYRLSKTKKVKYFISQWIGETGLPLRFLCPPTIYVIDLN